MIRNAQRLDELELRLQRTMISRLNFAKIKLDRNCDKLHNRIPLKEIVNYKTNLKALRHRLINTFQQKFERLDNRLANASQTLHAVSPLATLSRGYSLTTNEQGAIINSSQDVEIGDLIRTRLANGHLTSKVSKIEND